MWEGSVAHTYTGVHTQRRDKEIYLVIVLQGPSNMLVIRIRSNHEYIYIHVHTVSVDCS